MSTSPGFATASNVTTWRSAGQLGLHLAQLVELRLAGDERHRRARVAQDVGGLARRQGGVDRDVRRTEGERGVVGDGPLGPVLGQDRDPVAGSAHRGRRGRG